MEGAGQAGVALAAPTIARDAPDYYAGVVANALLGGGYSSRLNQELRVRRGLTYGVGSSLDARRRGGVWRIAAQTKNESAAEFVQVTLDEVTRVSMTAPPADELDARKLAVIGAVSRRYETTGSLAAVLAGLEATGIPPAEITRTIEAVSAVTLDQVLAFARKHWASTSRHRGRGRRRAVRRCAARDVSRPARGAAGQGGPRSGGPGPALARARLHHAGRSARS